MISVDVCRSRGYRKTDIIENGIRRELIRIMSEDEYARPKLPAADVTLGEE
jgi:hypothetical protein